MANTYVKVEGGGDHARASVNVIGRATLDVNSSDATNLHFTLSMMPIVSPFLSWRHREIPPRSRPVAVLFWGLLWDF